VRYYVNTKSAPANVHGAKANYWQKVDIILTTADREAQSRIAFVRDAPAALDMIAEALAFVVPGDSAGLLDVNSAASDLEGLIATL